MSTFRRWHLRLFLLISDRRKICLRHRSDCQRLLPRRKLQRASTELHRWGIQKDPGQRTLASWPSVHPESVASSRALPSFLLPHTSAAPRNHAYSETAVLVAPHCPGLRRPRPPFPSERTATHVLAHLRKQGRLSSRPKDRSRALPQGFGLDEMGQVECSCQPKKISKSLLIRCHLYCELEPGKPVDAEAPPWMPLLCQHTFLDGTEHRVRKQSDGRVVPCRHSLRTGPLREGLPERDLPCHLKRIELPSGGPKTWG